MSNPKRDRNDKGQLRKMTAAEKDRRGSRRLARAERGLDGILMEDRMPHSRIVDRILGREIRGAR